jgi:hypothetical protein
MLVWGGVGFTWYNDGGIYDPKTDSWTPMTLEGAPEGRSYHVAFWTGTEMLVWGGENLYRRFRDGFLYNPKTDTWRPISMDGAPGERESYAAVWTGGGPLPRHGAKIFPGGQGPDGEMLIWGGGCASGYEGTCQGEGDWLTWDTPYGYLEFVIYRDGFAYNPKTDAWRPMSMEGAPSPRFLFPSVWAQRGSRPGHGELLVWGGGWSDWFTQSYLDDGAAYDPAKDRWRPLPSRGAPSARRKHEAVWTGSEMVQIGGHYGNDDQGYPYYSQDGAVLTPWGMHGDTWRLFQGEVPPHAGEGSTMLWTGREVLIWGGGSALAKNHPYGTVFPKEGWILNPDGCGNTHGGSFQFWGGFHDDGINPADATQTGASLLPVCP